MAPRSPRRGRSRSPSGATRRRVKHPAARSKAAEPAADFEEVTERAARLGITVERVLQEYANIAFADLRHIIDWGHGEVAIKAPEDLSEADAASIQEIVVTEGKRPSRVKLYDKKAALDAIARHLGMFLPLPRRNDDMSADPAEDAREELARLVARLVTGDAAAKADPIAEPEERGDAEA